MIRRLLLLSSLFALLSSASHGEPWTIDDLLRFEDANSVVVDREGRRVAWSQTGISTVEGEEKPVSHLFLSRLDAEDGEPLQLTRGNWRDSRPRFSPDSRHLAFISPRDLPAGTNGDESGGPQLWALPLEGGEPFPLTHLERAVRDFAWLDAETLVIAAQESPARREKRLEKEEDTSIVVDDADNEPPVRLFRVGLDGEVERLTQNDDWIDALAVSPDGRWAVTSAQQSLSYPFDSKVPPHVYLVDLKSGERQRILADSDLLPFGVQFKFDGSGFYFLNPHTTHPRYRMAFIVELYEYDLERAAAEKIDLGWDRGVADYAVTANGLVTLLEDGVRYRPLRFTRHATGWDRRPLEGEHVSHIFDLVASHDGATVVYETSSVTEPPQWYAARLEGSRLTGGRQITRLNPGYDEKPKGEAEILRWTGALGEEVEGILQYPLDEDFSAGENAGPRPLVLDIHGGPLGADHDSWYQGWGAPNVLWRQHGAYVLQVNYHGSSGYGLEWAESIRERYYELEIPDIEAGVDLLLERGLVDPERLGSVGWSNGGILTAELITRTRRYKAAVVGAADVEWLSDWANVDFGASFDHYYFGGPPWEIPEVYIEKSPFFRLTEVTTPTLIHTGTEDRNVPPHQSWSLFRALQYLEKTPVRLVLYPGEAHSLRKIAHRRRKIAEDVAWLEQHLFGIAEPPTPALVEDSPLAALLARARATRHGGHFGRVQDGVLIPETVELAGLEIGRFEVTRAQWASFDAEYVPAAGKGDLPMTGMTFHRAVAYADWLATTTGRPFRLPTRQEAERLAGLAGDGGNTLDRWAGYTPNPEDAARLASAVAGLDGQAPLLLPVGQAPGTGEDPVFDLDGNAAEWAVDEDGVGVALGASAERSTDPLGSILPAPGYTGLRVVVGKRE